MERSSTAEILHAAAAGVLNAFFCIKASRLQARGGGVLALKREEDINPITHHLCEPPSARSFVRDSRDGSQRPRASTVLVGSRAPDRGRRTRPSAHQNGRGPPAPKRGGELNCITNCYGLAAADGLMQLIRRGRNPDCGPRLDRTSFPPLQSPGLERGRVSSSVSAGGGGERRRAVRVGFPHIWGADFDPSRCFISPK